MGLLKIIKIFFTDLQDIENSVALNLIRVSTGNSVEKAIRPRSVTDILLDKKQKHFISEFDTDKTDDEDNKNLIDITGKYI